jgi:biotin-dependent carboxylase-like uncharacterized protein
MPARSVTVVDPGPLSLVQDPGRPGLASLGVPRSGWLDDGAARTANRLVGNPEDAAVLECLLGGLVLVTGRAMTVAVTGATCPVALADRPAAHGAPLSARAGDTLRLGRTVAGARCYVAVSGGIDVPAVAGSRATDTLSGIGPPRPAPGTALPVGRPAGPPGLGEAVPLTVGGPGPAVLRLHPGPRADWVTAASWQRLTGASYSVAPASDRIGLRLDGPRLEHEPRGELPSEGLVLGAVQVPPDGRPVVFLRDHPTTGGYPVGAVVDPADLDRCAQLLPGDAVTFRLSPSRRWPPEVATG